MSILGKLVAGVGKTLAGTALEHFDLPGKWDDPLRDSLKKILLGTKDAPDDELAHVIAARANDPEILKQLHAASTNAMMQREQLAHDNRIHERESQLKRDLAQNETNQLNAQSDDKFKSWWRPAVGWVCVSGLLYTFLLRPVFSWVMVLSEISGEAPPIDTSELVVLLFGMLGIGATRSFDKITKARGDDDQH